MWFHGVKLKIIIHWCNIWQNQDCQHLTHDLLKFWKVILQTKWKKIQLVQIILPMKINSQKCHLDLVPSFKITNDNQITSPRYCKPWPIPGHKKSLLTRAWYICQNDFFFHQIVIPIDVMFDPIAKNIFLGWHHYYQVIFTPRQFHQTRNPIIKFFKFESRPFPSHLTYKVFLKIRL